jgi:predicted nucleotidyltransferase
MSWFVAGATARDILLTHVFGRPAGRATRDVDFAVAVESWEQFEAFKVELTAMGSFVADPRAMQRLYYKPVSPSAGYPVDLIPFGGVESPHGTVAWPRDTGVMMNVIGYREAIDAALSVRVAAGLTIRVASLPGLALLKLFAWADRGDTDPRDAFDLATLFRRYAEAGNMDRLYGEESATLAAVDYDPDLASPRLLGRDLRAMAEPATLERVAALLDDPKMLDRLALHVAKAHFTAADPVDSAYRLLAQFRAGLGNDEG